MKLMFIKTFNMHVYNNSECFDASFKQDLIGSWVWFTNIFSD